MSIITTFLGSKIAVGFLAAGMVSAGGAVAITTTVAAPATTEAVAPATVGTEIDGDILAEAAPSDPATTTPETTEGSTETDTEDATGEAATENSTGASNRPSSSPSAFGLCTAFVNGGLSTNSTAYVVLEGFAAASGNVDADAKGSVNPSAYCAAVVATKNVATERAASATAREKSSTTKITVTGRP